MHYSLSRLCKQRRKTDEDNEGERRIRSRSLLIVILYRRSCMIDNYLRDDLRLKHIPPIVSVSFTVESSITISSIHSSINELSVTRLHN